MCEHCIIKNKVVKVHMYYIYYIGDNPYRNSRIGLAKKFSGIVQADCRMNGHIKYLPLTGHLNPILQIL